MTAPAPKPAPAAAAGKKPSVFTRLKRSLGFDRLDPHATGVTDSPFLYRTDRVVGERYRTLAWMMDQLRQKQNFQVLTITSSVASEGKSTVSVNLAAVLAERSDHRVLLIDFDMRRPRVGDLLGAEAPGILELLMGECTLEEAIHSSPDFGFSYIPVTAPVDDPLQILSNQRVLGPLLEKARQHFDYVLLDAPPIMPVSDPLFLSEASDAVLFVVRAGETSGRMLSRALSVVRKDRLLGIVFNGTSRGMGYHYDPYYQYKRKRYSHQQAR